jgi:hypothetical protein
MKIGGYDFNVGDEVISVGGIRGKIVDICQCEECANRGLFEPIWKHDDENEVEYITNYDFEFCFPGYHKIGNYTFWPLDKAFIIGQIEDREQNLARLKRQLQTIEELESTGA